MNEAFTAAAWVNPITQAGDQSPLNLKLCHLYIHMCICIYTLTKVCIYTKHTFIHMHI